MAYESPFKDFTKDAGILGDFSSPQNPNSSGQPYRVSQAFLKQHMDYHTMVVQNALANSPLMTSAVRQMVGRGLTHDEAMYATHSSPMGGIARAGMALMDRIQPTSAGSVVNTALNFGDTTRRAMMGGVLMGGIPDSDSAMYGSIGLQAQIQGQLQRAVGQNFGPLGLGRVNGFNQEEFSSIFNAMTRRVGMGDFIRRVDNATEEDVYAHASLNESSPRMRDILQRAAGTTAAEKLRSIETTYAGDTEAQDLTQRLRGTTSFFETDEVAVQKVSDLVKSVTKSLSSISDIYSELQGEELLMKLEDLTGMQISSSDQALQARQAVTRMRSTAGMMGVDERFYMEGVRRLGFDYGNLLSGLPGMDQRHVGMLTNVGTMMAQQFSANAAAAQLDFSADNGLANKLRGLGVSISPFDTTHRIRDDQVMMNRMMELDPTSLALEGLRRGALSYDDDFVSRAAELRRARLRASSPEDLARISSASRELMNSKDVTPGMEIEALNALQNSAAGRSYAADLVDRAAVTQTDTGMAGRLGGALGLSNGVSRRLARYFREDRGATFMADLAGAFAAGTTSDFYSAQIDSGEMTLEEASFLERSLMSGAMSSEDRAELLAGNAAVLSKSAAGGRSRDDRARAAQQRARMQLDSIRKTQEAVGNRKGSFLSRILTAGLFGKGAAGVDSDAAKRAFLSAALADPEQGELVRSFGLGEGTEIDFSNGLSRKELSDLARINGTTVSEFADELGLSPQALVREASRGNSRAAGELRARYGSDMVDGVFSLTPGASKNTFFRMSGDGQQKLEEHLNLMGRAADLRELGILESTGDVDKFLSGTKVRDLAVGELMRLSAQHLSPEEREEFAKQRESMSSGERRLRGAGNEFYGSDVGDLLDFNLLEGKQLGMLRDYNNSTQGSILKAAQTQMSDLARFNDTKDTVGILGDADAGEDPRMMFVGEMRNALAQLIEKLGGEVESAEEQRFANATFDNVTVSRLTMPQALPSEGD